MGSCRMHFLILSTRHVLLDEPNTRMHNDSAGKFKSFLVAKLFDEAEKLECFLVAKLFVAAGKSKSFFVNNFNEFTFVCKKFVHLAAAKEECWRERAPKGLSAPR